MGTQVTAYAVWCVLGVGRTLLTENWRGYDVSIGDNISDTSLKDKWVWSLTWQSIQGKGAGDLLCKAREHERILNTLMLLGSGRWEVAGITVLHYV